MKTSEITWNSNDGYRFFLGRLPAEAFGEKAAYELIRIERSSNLQRGKAKLDTRYSRTVEDPNAILDAALETAPANARRILRRFAE